MTILTTPRVDSNTDTPKSRPIRFVSRDARGRRYELRSALQRSYSAERRSENEGLCSCGAPLNVSNGVAVRSDGTRAGYGGTKSCGRASVCPTCAAKVGAHRSGEITQVVQHYADRDCTVFMLTLTMRHNRSQSLAELWAALSAGWKAATNGRKWRKERDEYGIDGYVRATETTWSEKNGWHLHIHSLICFEGEVSNERIKHLSESMFARWSAKLEEKGLDAPTLAHGVDWKRLGKKPADCDVLASYLTKITSGIAFEVGNSTEKKGRRQGHLSTWQIAQEAVRGTGDKLMMAIWLEWLEESRGKRMLNWSRGLRAQVGIGAELTDEEVAAQEVGGDQVATIPARSWGIMRTEHSQLLGDVLRLVEGGHDWRALDQLVSRADPRLTIYPPDDESIKIFGSTYAEMLCTEDISPLGSGWVGPIAQLVD